MVIHVGVVGQDNSEYDIFKTYQSYLLLLSTNNKQTIKLSQKCGSNGYIGVIGQA